MNKTFDGHTPNENSLLNLDSSDTHIHSIEAKRYKFNNDSATYLWHYRLGHIVNAATTLHLELFQMVAPLYVFGLLLRVIRIGVKACIDVTLYAELFITSITEKHFLILLRIILTDV